MSFQNALNVCWLRDKTKEKDLLRVGTTIWVSCVVSKYQSLKFGSHVWSQNVSHLNFLLFSNSYVIINHNSKVRSGQIRLQSEVGNWAGNFIKIVNMEKKNRNIETQKVRKVLYFRNLYFQN